jgi:2-keto-4-pentenoate hydratase/2-oxohepta-3-ene-1,7-dioic acid hydratase in catechol pathway
MKLVRFGPAGEEKPGIVDPEGRIRDLSSVVHDVDGVSLSPASLQRISALDTNELPLVASDVRLGACVGGVGKFVCIGLNYVDHAREANRDIPEEPVVFMKATSSLAGPNDPVRVPPGCEKVDWEVELGVVIGRTAKRIDQADALNHVAGYCLVDDLSERHFQSHRGGQWVKGKSLDTFGPVGPWLVTRDELPDPQRIHLWHDVDDRRYQDGNTADMIFSVPYLVSYLSHFMTLQPGDIIATGTPAGVGLGQKPAPMYLRVGQELRLGADGLGEQRHLLVSDD